MSFPYHTVPDGSVAVPHHATWSLILALVPLLVVWDHHSHTDPWPELTVLLVALIAFLLVWPRYPYVGAALTVAAVLALLLLPFRPTWSSHWPLAPRVAVMLLAAVAADDVLQHAFGWVTPLDWLWKHGLRDAITVAG